MNDTNKVTLVLVQYRQILEDLHRPKSMGFLRSLNARPNILLGIYDPMHTVDQVRTLLRNPSITDQESGEPYVFFEKFFEGCPKTNFTSIKKIIEELRTNKPELKEVVYVCRTGDFEKTCKIHADVQKMGLECKVVYHLSGLRKFFQQASGFPAKGAATQGNDVSTPTHPVPNNPTPKI